MHSFLGQFVVRWWPGVIVAWIVLVVAAHWAAPPWDGITHDGDLAFLPAWMPSAQGEQLARTAFPNSQSRSQIALIVARTDGPLDAEDMQFADRLAARFYDRIGVANLLGGSQVGAGPSFNERARVKQPAALLALDEAVRLDEQFAEAWHHRGLACEQLGDAQEAEKSRAIAWELRPELKQAPSNFAIVYAESLPIADIWTRHHKVFGAKLRSKDKQAQLIVLHLSNEFMATDNIRVLRVVHEELERARSQADAAQRPGLQVGISGSAAVGGDMLSAAAESIRNTELLTITLVVVILFVVYRAPLLVLVPMATIVASLSVAVDCLALLTQLHFVSGFEWFDFKVFKTTKIFIVVILYGSGTDFCLFLLARLREEIPRTSRVAEAVQQALTHVGPALVASAFTTICGLAMMFFADFGKFRNSGPAIGLCLFITLAACLTLAPALLCALGRAVFWPFQVPSGTDVDSRSVPRESGAPFWHWLADRLVRRPIPILATCVMALLPLAAYGFFSADRVTFDFLSELPPGRLSMQGNDLLKQHFPVGEGGPVIVLARRVAAGFDSEDEDTASRGMAAIFDLTEQLAKVPGVESVRSLAAPLGDKPKPIAISGVARLVQREHQLTKALFLAQLPPYRGETTRFELVLRENPFSLAAQQSLTAVAAELSEARDLPDSYWHGAEFMYTGTTAGIRDLRAVTRSDYWRIQILVTAAVWGVLVWLLKRPAICVYLIVSVLFSYFVTIGATELFFGSLYGESFVGLDWKVPIFLFVILVAVGEDYNIYLVTRVLEEQAHLGLFAGLRAGIQRTGGIITSCGIIMAGSFVSMVTGSLRGISELGFALTLGILLDTFVVRTLLVPAFLSLAFRRQELRRVQQEQVVKSRR